MDYLNGVFVNEKLMKQMKQVSDNRPRTDVNVISPMHLHFFETNNMFLGSNPGSTLKRTHYGQSECQNNNLVMFTKKEMEMESTLQHIKERLQHLSMAKFTCENVQKMVDLLRFVFTLRCNKIAEGLNFRITGFYCDPAAEKNLGEIPTWVVVIDSPIYEDCSDASEWKAREEKFPFRFAIYTLKYGRYGDGDLIA